MTQAQYWHSICAMRLMTPEPDLLHPWCRGVLGDAAKKTMTTGFCGRVWLFDDGSRIVVQREGVRVG